MGHKLIKIYLYSIVLLVLGLIISVSGSISSSLAYADDSSAVDSFNLSLPVSCTIGSSGGNHTQSVINNQYYGNLGGAPTIFTMFCNDKNGFVVYAVGSSNSTEGNTSLIGSTGQNIPTGVYDPSNINTSVSSWSFKLGNTDGTIAISSSYNDNLFHTIPATWTEVAKKQEGTVNSTTGSQITAIYDAYISGVQAAGSYTGQVKYVVMHPSSSTQPVTLVEAFKNAGKQKVPATDPITGESGEYYKMQDMNTTICSSANITGEASQMEAVDIRDDKLYWITKMADGKCWMTENLDLDLETTPTSVATLTSENTNLKLYGSMGYTTANGYSCSNDSPACENGIITWAPERATIPEGSLSSATWQNDYNNPYSYDNGLATPKGKMGGHGYTGNYYNWTASIASNASNSYTTSVAANSICPKGWRLPNAASMEGGYEFSELFYAYGVTKDDKNGSGYATGGYNNLVGPPLYFAPSGFITGGQMSSYDNYGYYWSNAPRDSKGSYTLYFGSGSNQIWPASYGNSDFMGRFGGRSLRCLAE